MKKIVSLFLLAFLASSLSYAYEEPLSRGECFIVKNNVPQKIQKCFISAVGGAGGVMRTYEIGSDEYAHEMYAASAVSEDVYRIKKNKSKAINAMDYSRQNKSLKVVKNPKKNDWNCLKDTKSISDFCFRY